MTQLPFSRRIAAVLESIAPIARFASESAYARRLDDPANCDFVFGNPHEMPLSDYTVALQRWVVPQRDDWFAYKMSEPAGQAVIAGSLLERHGLPFEDEDVFLTTGAFAGLAITLGAVIDPGDDVIYVSPPWFFYEAQILSLDARPIRVSMNRETFDLDLDAIAAALSERTRAIIVNSPHNPTGKIYPPETLAELARILTQASERHGRAIYLLSDEAYSRNIFDGREYHSPTRYYPHSFLIRWSLVTSSKAAAHAMCRRWRRICTPFGAGVKVTRNWSSSNIRRLSAGVKASNPCRTSSANASRESVSSSVSPSGFIASSLARSAL